MILSVSPILGDRISFFYLDFWIQSRIHQKKTSMERKKTFSVLFWLRKSRTNESLSPLFCRVTIMGQRYEIPTNCHISAASWSAAAQKSLGKTAADKETNRYIEDLKLQIEETCNKLRQKNHPLNIENFKLYWEPCVFTASFSSFLLQR